MAVRLSLTKEVRQALVEQERRSSGVCKPRYLWRGEELAAVIHAAMDRLRLSLSHYLLPLPPLD